MKRASVIVLLISAAATLGISSCNKNKLSPVNENVNGTAPATAPYASDLIVEHWNRMVTEGVYTCTFKNIIPSGYRNYRDVKVYVLNTDQKIQINEPVLFMGGELSATTTTSDITINYRWFRELPFDHLKIIIEIK